MAQKTDAQLQTDRNTIESNTAANSNTAAIVGQMFEDIIDSKLHYTEFTREFNRAWTATINFDKSEIFYTSHVATGNITFEIGTGNLVDQASSARQIITLNGSQSLSFGSGFDFFYGITNGEVVAAGTYEIYFLHTNGAVTVNFPGVSSESSGAVVLSVPSNFAAVADGETAIDLSWTDVSNESSYLIEFSLTGTGGWATLDTPAANATTSTQTSLSAGDTRYYRIKAIGDGVNFLDSAFSGVISGQTESSGDVTAPTFTFVPASGVTTWSVNRGITITANEPIRNTDGSEITNANVASRITLKETNSGGANIAFTATIDGTKTIIVVTPTTHYGENQLVYVAINNVEDVNGNEVTVAVSSTFTTTDYTFFNGTSNRLIFGDTLDSVIAVNDAEFWLELTVKDLTLSGSRVFVGKSDSSSNQRGFKWLHTNTDIIFAWWGLGNTTQVHLCTWAGALSAGEHVFVLKYNGAIDTNDGLDRLTLLDNGGTVGSKTIDGFGGPLHNIFDNTAQLTVGVVVNSAGTPVTGEGFLSGEAKDFIVRSTSGSVVEVNIPNLKLGTDTSGNGIDGTWV